MTKKITLKKGRDKSVKNGHHWVFSGAVDKMPPCDPGDLATVVSSEGDLLGWGYAHPTNSIAVRMLSFDSTHPEEAIPHRIQEAKKERERLLPANTTGYRLINGEGDGLPGLIVDVYGEVAVLQVSTAGIDRLKPLIVSSLGFKHVFEKSAQSIRKQEGLKPCQEWVLGGVDPEIKIQERGLQFIANIEEGQKTGFFFDQREMRHYVQELSHGRSVLNAFCYTGGFSVYAAKGGAKKVTSIDISGSALQLAKRNLELNGYSTGVFIEADVFDFLRQEALQEDLIILDPPAFAKRKHDIVAACRGYKDLNRVTMGKMSPGSLLLTCSCSQYVDEALFQQVLFQAASEAKRNVRIVSRHRLAADHPIHINHPEGDYLKSFLLYVE